MSDIPKTYGEIVQVVNEYFADLIVRVEAAQNFCLAMVLENSLTNAEVDLLKSELQDKFKI